MKVKMILQRCVRSLQRSGFDSRSNLNFSGSDEDTRLRVYPSFPVLLSF